jgi:hypothetical protein
MIGCAPRWISGTQASKDTNGVISSKTSSATLRGLFREAALAGTLACSAQAMAQDRNVNRQENAALIGQSPASERANA